MSMAIRNRPRNPIMRYAAYTDVQAAARPIMSLASCPERRSAERVYVSSYVALELALFGAVPCEEPSKR